MASGNIPLLISRGFVAVNHNDELPDWGPKIDGTLHDSIWNWIQHQSLNISGIHSRILIPKMECHSSCSQRKVREYLNTECDFLVESIVDEVFHRSSKITKEEAMTRIKSSSTTEFHRRRYGPSYSIDEMTPLRRDLRSSLSTDTIENRGKSNSSWELLIFNVHPNLDKLCNSIDDLDEWNFSLTCIRIEKTKGSFLLGRKVNYVQTKVEGIYHSN